MKKSFALSLCLLTCFSAVAESSIDASDPTKIYSYAGAGYKHTDFTNGKSLSEVRATGNVGISQQDMVLFELGYGESETETGNESGMTNSRARWFHVFDMDYTVATGFRGWASQVDLQVAGSIPGTDGANVLAVGALPAFGISETWSLFLPVSLAVNWDKGFDSRRGTGVAISPLFVYVPQWWTGSFVQIWPTYTRFIEGDISGEGGANLDVSIGGSITETVLWGVTYQQNFDKDFSALKRGVETGYGNDWNVFGNVSVYF